NKGSRPADHFPYLLFRFTAKGTSKNREFLALFLSSSGLLCFPHLIFPLKRLSSNKYMPLSLSFSTHRILVQQNDHSKREIFPGYFRLAFSLFLLNRCFNFGHCNSLFLHRELKEFLPIFYAANIIHYRLKHFLTSRVNTERIVRSAR